MKIPFDIKFRPQIESGEYKVVTRDNIPVRIICWDANIEQPIVGLVYDSDAKCETVKLFCNDGGYRVFMKEDSPFDLFVIAPEPELTEFEKGLLDYAKARDEYEFDSTKVVELNQKVIELTKSYSKTLIAIAKKELCEGCVLKEADENRVYKYVGPYMPVYWPCHYGGECTNPFHDCINCHRQSTGGINTTTGTSTAKVEGKK